MRKKLTLILFIGLLSSMLTSYAQDNMPVMKFDNKEFDFGTFKEENGKMTHTFEFINTGSQPVIINQVRSSCGCTSPDWSRKPVAPGEKGFIKATYDPHNRPGAFNKSITITANTNPSVHILRIRGDVTPRVKTAKDLYPRVMNGLRLKNNHLSFTKIKNSETKEASLPVMNDSDQSIKVSFSELPAHLSVKMVPEVLQPKQEGKIIATYNAVKKNDWGFVTDYLNIAINDEYSRNNRLVISANIEEDFSKLSAEELARAPKIEFKDKVFDFGELNQGDKAEHTFVLQNTGKSDLIIRKTKASCGCTAISPQKNVIKPGEQTEIKVVFNSRGKRGRQNKLVTVITNDPVSASTRLRVIGNVLETMN